MYRGTIYDIYTGLGLNPNNHGKILRVLIDVNTCAELGIEYTGEAPGVEKVGRPSLLQVKSKDARVLADAMEQHLGLSMAHRLICNRRIKEMGPQGWVGMSAVYGLHKKLKPVVTPIEKCKQGKTYPRAHWSVAREVPIIQTKFTAV